MNVRVKMNTGWFQVLKKAFLSCFCASLLFAIACFFIEGGGAGNDIFDDEVIIYENLSKLEKETVEISDSSAKNLNEVTIITEFSYDYKPQQNYYATIIDSCNSRFRLMMHEHSHMRAYCNSGILWAKTVNNFQVNKVLSPTEYHVVFTYKNGEVASYIDGNLNLEKDVTDKDIDLNKFSLLMNCPKNEEMNFGDEFVGEVTSITILKKALNPGEVAECFKGAIKNSAGVKKLFLVKYFLPWTILVFVCWYLPNIFSFFSRCFSPGNLIDKFILFIYIIFGIFFIVYNIGESFLKEIHSSSSGRFIASYTFWLLYFCFLSLYWSVLYKFFRCPLMTGLSCLYFVTALLIYSLWLHSIGISMSLACNLLMTFCVATFMAAPLLFEKD